MSQSGIEKLDQQLNLIKTKDMECLRLLLEYSLNKVDAEKRSVIPLTHKAKGVAPLLIKTAHAFATSHKLDALLQDECLNEFMVQLLEILALLSDEREYFDIFIQNQSHILVSICMNLIATSTSEAELIVNDPAEFVNLGLDCCDKQQSMIIKTQACKLLEHMCDNVDGASTFVTTFACNALNLAL